MQAKLQGSAMTLTIWRFRKPGTLLCRASFDPVSADVAVAVIDWGMICFIPTLTWKPVMISTAVQEEAPRDSHGTAVAGNIGAIYNNGIGVIGTAPNVKILSIFYGYTYANMAAAIDSGR